MKWARYNCNTIVVNVGLVMELFFDFRVFTGWPVTLTSELFDETEGAPRMRCEGKAQGKLTGHLQDEGKCD